MPKSSLAAGITAAANKDNQQNNNPGAVASAPAAATTTAAAATKQSAKQSPAQNAQGIVIFSKRIMERIMVKDSGRRFDFNLRR